MTVETTRDGPVWITTNKRPEARNAVDPETADAFFAAFQLFNASDDALVCVLTGAGGAFCGGWDQKYASALTDRDDFDREIRRLAFPISAASADRMHGPLGQKADGSGRPAPFPGRDSLWADAGG